MLKINPKTGRENEEGVSKNILIRVKLTDELNKLLKEYALKYNLCKAGAISFLTSDIVICEQDFHRFSDYVDQNINQEKAMESFSKSNIEVPVYFKSITIRILKQTGVFRSENNYEEGYSINIETIIFMYIEFKLKHFKK